MLKTVAALALALTVAVHADDGALERSLTATEHVIYAPAGDLTSRSEASELGLLSRIARVAAVPFGFESDPASPRPASSVPVEPHYVKASTLRDALDAFVA